jgi:hypothetical protein
MKKRSAETESGLSGNRFSAVTGGLRLAACKVGLKAKAELSDADEQERNSGFRERQTATELRRTS